MNEESSVEKVDQYIKWVQSGHTTQITKKTEEMGARLLRAYNLLLKWPTESEALRLHREFEGLSEDTARRDIYFAQYACGKLQMPNRNFLIQKQLKAIDEFIEMCYQREPINEAILLKALGERSKIIQMLPEEVDPPSMDVFNQRIYYTPDPAAIGKTRKDIDQMKLLYQQIKAKSAPQINLGANAEDAEIVRS